MSFTISPPNTYLDNNGNPAVSFEVFVGKPNANPETPINKLVLTDSASGVTVSNPYIIDVDGHSKNTNGQLVNPECQEERYSILFKSTAGGQSYSYADIKSDALGIQGATSTADKVFNNLPLAQGQDLSEFDFIFTQSETAGWEDTPAGPLNSFYAHKTGVFNAGSSGTGDADLFFDSIGNQFKKSIASKDKYYKGCKLQGDYLFASGDASSQDIIFDEIVQGDTFDYGGSGQDIVIPANADFTHGYIIFSCDYNNILDRTITAGNLAELQLTVNGSVTPTDGQKTLDWSNITLARSGAYESTKVFSVSAGDIISASIICNLTYSVPGDATWVGFLEFIPIYNATITSV